MRRSMAVGGLRLSLGTRQPDPRLVIANKTGRARSKPSVRREHSNVYSHRYDEIMGHVVSNYIQGIPGTTVVYI